MPNLDTINFGDRVTIVDRFGKERTGKATLRGPGGWVLNMGGPHGTPAVAHEGNITKVRKGKANPAANAIFGNAALRFPDEI